MEKKGKMTVERDKLIAMVQGLQNGEGEAMTVMYETFRDDFYYFILKTVNKDHHLAEDLTQSTFVHIIEKINTLEEPVAFVTWAKQIAYHKCTDYFKKHKDLLLDENEEGKTLMDIKEEDNPEFLPDACAEREELRKILQDMIDNLPEEQRSALLLRYYNEVSIKDIAQIQSVSEGTVKSRLNYARKFIKQSVEDYEKKNGIKLHCAGVVPLLLWLFRQYRIANKLSLTAGTSTQPFSAVQHATTTTISNVTAASNPVTTNTVKATAKVGIKAASLKIVACAVAVTLVVGGISSSIAAGNKKQPQEIEQASTAAVQQEEEETVSTTEDGHEKPVEQESLDIKLQDYLDFTKSWGVRTVVHERDDFIIEQVCDFAFAEDGTFYCLFYQQNSGYILGFYGHYMMKGDQLELIFDLEEGTTTSVIYSFNPDTLQLTQVSENGLLEKGTVGTTYELVNDDWKPTAEDIISMAQMHM